MCIAHVYRRMHPQVEKTNDDSVRLKILQTALTLLQNVDYVDDEVSAHRTPSPKVTAATLHATPLP
jgi:hypothetical protein